MTRSSRFLLPFALIALATSLAVGVPRGAAIDPFPNVGITTLSSEHFMIHYNRDDHSTDCPTMFITQEQAGDVLGMAERAYALYTSWGYSAPILDAGGGLLDLSADQFSIPPDGCISYGSIDPSIPREADGTLSRWDALINPVLPPGAGEIHLDSVKGLSYHTIAHEVFHLFQGAITTGGDRWLEEGTAEWAAVRADSAIGGVEANSDRTLDCVGSECGDTEFDKNGYPGWMLFEYLAERYGDAKVKQVWDNLAATPMSGTKALASVLPTNLGDFFNDYTTTRLNGNFTSPVLAGVLPPAQAMVALGKNSGSFSIAPIAVNHLAVRYLDLAHAADTDTGPCYVASLKLNVTIPANVVSKPYYYANILGSVPQALSVSGSTASITVPWDTCSGSPHAYLSLPNDWNDADQLGAPKDGREFVITGTLTFDKSKPASAASPPPGVKVIGPVVETPTTDPAPDLTVYAPELLRVSAKTRVLRFVVFSSGTGALRAVLGSSWNGSATLHAGNNDIRFVLPTQLLKRLRKTSSGKTSSENVLSLTSYSPSGARGETVTRRVALQATKPKRRK
jgi:hypothetical protein